MGVTTLVTRWIDEWMDEQIWFFACWCKFRKVKNYFTNFWVVVVKNGYGILISEWMDESGWFFAYILPWVILSFPWLILVYYCLCDLQEWSLWLTGVETLEWVLQKFKRRFHFFNLVSDFFSGISQKTGFNYWYQGTDLFTSLT